MDEEELLAEIEARLIYDASEGAFYRRPGYPGIRPGSRVGSPDGTGKRQAKFCGRRFQVATLVWLVETRRLPPGPLTRRNGDDHDDRFENLVVWTPSYDCSRRAAEFKSRACARFGTAHDLSRVKYVNRGTPVRIVCAVHGAFERTPERYLASAYGCPECGADAAAAAGREAGLMQKKTPGEKRATRHLYVAANRDLYRAASRRWYRRAKAENAERFSEYQRSHRVRHRGEPDFEAARICRSTLARVLRATKSKKDVSCAELLGYSTAEFRAHLEALFEPWMTWANHGLPYDGERTWQVDHRVPLRWFLRQGIYEPRVINALKNLRPLESARNSRKGAQITIDPRGVFPELDAVSARVPPRT